VSLLYYWDKEEGEMALAELKAIGNKISI